MENLFEASSNPLRSLELIESYIRQRNLDPKYDKILFDAIQKCLEEYSSELSGGSPELTLEQIEYINSCTNASFSVKNGRVNINGTFNSGGRKEGFKGIKFGIIKGSFDCRSMGLTSTEGFPTKVKGSFVCSDNSLTSLVGGPIEVKEDFYCSNNKLTNLEGAPLNVGGNFICTNNELTSLSGSPEIGGYLFDCSYNKLKSLDGCPNTVDSINACSNPIEILFRDPRDIKVSLNKLIVDKGTPLKGISDNINNGSENFLLFVDPKDRDNNQRYHYGMGINVFKMIEDLLSSVEGINKLSYIEILSNRGII